MSNMGYSSRKWTFSLLNNTHQMALFGQKENSVNLYTKTLSWPGFFQFSKEFLRYKGAEDIVNFIRKSDTRLIWLYLT